jgi:hypothetical protein
MAFNFYLKTLFQIHMSRNLLHMPTFGNVEYEWLWMISYKLRGSSRPWRVLRYSQAEKSPQCLSTLYQRQVWESNEEFPESKARCLTVRFCYVLRKWQWCLCFIRWSLRKFTISGHQCSVYESWQCVISDESLSQYKERGCNTGILRALIQLTTTVGTLDLN